MKQALSILAALVAASAAAFSSERWMAARDDDSDAERLAGAYRDCLARTNMVAKDVAFPLETFADGTVKSQLTARQAQLFVDTGMIWGEGVEVVQFGRGGKSTNGVLRAENCVVDRKTKTGWVDGRAALAYGKTVVQGRRVYFSFEKEYVKIFEDSEIRSKGLKLDARRMMR